jgi:hypothetical protein
MAASDSSGPQPAGADAINFDDDAELAWWPPGGGMRRLDSA